MISKKVFKICIYRNPDLYSELCANLVYKYLNNFPEFLVNLVSNSGDMLYIIPDLAIIVGSDINYFYSVHYFYNEKVKLLCLDPSIIPNNKDNINSKLDAVICVNLKVKESYIGRGIAEDKIFVCGSPILDEIKNANICGFGRGNGIEIYFNLDWSLGKEEEQVEALAKIALEPIGHIYCNVRHIKEGYRLIKRFGTFNTWRHIKKAIQLKKLYIVEPTYLDILNILKSTNVTVSCLSDTLIYSILMSQPTITIGKTSNNLGLQSIQDHIDLDNLKLSFTEEQINFYLLNYLPCMFDNNNMKRISMVIQQFLYSILAVEDFENSLRNRFSSINPQLLDPLHFIKLEALTEATVNKIF